jgi:hypothetical protein
MTWRRLRGDGDATIAKKWNELSPGTLARLDSYEKEYQERPDFLAIHDPKELAKDHEVLALQATDLVRMAIKRFAKRAALDLTLRATANRFERVVSVPLQAPDTRRP